MDAYRSDDWLQHDSAPAFSQRAVFEFDRPDHRRCDLCGGADARAMTLDVWRLGARRRDGADAVLELTLCNLDTSPNRWSADDWRWLHSGAYRARAA